MAALQAAEPVTNPDTFNTQGSTSSAIPSNVPGLVQSSSDVSVMTIETDQTSLESVNGELSRYHDRTPPRLVPLTLDTSSVDDKNSSDGSTPSVDAFELNRASKRTSSGTVKGLLADSHVHPVPTRDGGKEVTATEVCFPSRRRVRGAFLVMVAHQVQLSSQLKTRLKYAMVKIQNGWEKQSIEQLETLAASHSPPPASAPRMSRHSSSSPETYLMSPIVQTTPPQRSSKLVQSHVRSSSTNSIPGPLNSASNYHPPSLAPAPQITSSRRTNRRSLTSRAPPLLSRTNFDAHKTVDGSPVTPSNRIPAGSLLGCNGILQNQAEKDAVDSLLFMSSPNNSNNMKYSQEPAMFARPKRVGFESPPDLR
jgi:hypothetical protein